MDIFRHRPLFFWCAVFMVSLAAGAFLPMIAGGILCGIWIAGAVLFALWRYRRRDGYRAALAIVAAVMAFLALGRGASVFQGRDAERLTSLEHTTVSVTGLVTDRRGSGGYLTAYTLSLESVDGQKSDGLAVLTCHYMADLRPGNRVTLTAEVIPLSEAAGDAYDALALVGDGYRVGLLSEGARLVTVHEGDHRSWMARAGSLRRQLSARLDILVGDEGGGLPSSLLLGDKAYLDDNVRRDFSRAGVAHLLAISGLHMTLLFGLLAGFFCLIGLSKRIRACLLLGGVVGYLLLLGFPPSATRAAIMLGLTYLSHLCFTRADSLTSLGLAGASILAVTPYAVADAGFWMSFLATLGLVTIIPLVRPWTENRSALPVSSWRRAMGGRLLRGILAVFVGLVAVSFTLCIVAPAIGELGVLSPVSTILLTPFCGTILILSLLCLLTMGTAAGDVIGGVTGEVSRIAAEMTEWMARPSWVVVSLRRPEVAMLITVIATVMVGATLILLAVRLPARRRALVLLPMVVGWLSVTGVLTVHAYAAGDEVAVTYLQPSSVSESLVMVRGKEGVVCDFSNGSLSALTASVDEAKARGATELAVLQLTHYHTRTAGTLEILLRREMIRALWMPEPTNRTEYEILLSCMEKAKHIGVPICLYEDGEATRIFGEGTMRIRRAWLERSEQPVLLASIEMPAEDSGAERVVYCGSAVFESDLAETAQAWVQEAGVVVFGSHGPLCKKPYGTDLHWTSACAVILSAYGDAAAYLDPVGLPCDVDLWIGQKRWSLGSSAASEP